MADSTTNSSEVTNSDPDPNEVLPTSPEFVDQEEKQLLDDSHKDLSASNLNEQYKFPIQPVLSECPLWEPGYILTQSWQQNLNAKRAAERSKKITPTDVETQPKPETILVDDPSYTMEIACLISELKFCDEDSLISKPLVVWLYYIIQSSVDECIASKVIASSALKPKSSTLACKAVFNIEVPEHIQYNQSILNEQQLSFWGYIWSLFFIRNETINIYSHVFPLLIGLCCLENMYPWDLIQNNLSFILLGMAHFAASISFLLGSVFHHLWLYHRGGKSAYHLILTLDMLGTSIAQSCGGLASFTASIWYLSAKWRIVLHLLHLFVSLASLQLAIEAGSGSLTARQFSFIPVMCPRWISLIIRIFPIGGGDPNVILYVVLMEITTVIGVIRDPEKWFPERVSEFISSHVLTYLSALLAALLMHICVNADILWLLNTSSSDLST